MDQEKNKGKNTVKKAKKSLRQFDARDVKRASHTIGLRAIFLHLALIKYLFMDNRQFA